MSEWKALYLINHPLEIKDFDKVYVGDEDITTRIDKLQVAKVGDKYLVLAFKEANLVEIIPEGMKVKGIMLDEGYIGFSKGTTYKIEIE